MGTIPRFSRPGQFDRYCKLVLEHEAIDYLRKINSLHDHHISLSVLPQEEMDKFFTVDRYPHECMDEYMKHLLEIKLLHAIVAMN